MNINNKSEPGRPEYSWFELQQKNKPQSNAVAGGILVFMTAGYHVGWGIFNINVFNESWAFDESNFIIKLTINIYYIGTIIGLLLSFGLQYKLSKKSIYCVASIITIATGILLIIWPRSAINIMLNRLIFGIGNGFVLPTTIVHSAEVAVKEIRGMLLSTLSYGFNICLITIFLITLVTLNFEQDSKEIETIMIVGILALLNGCLALIATLFLFIESPIYLLKQNRPEEALRMITKLRKDNMVTRNNIVEYDEMKALIDEDIKVSSSILSDKNVRPLIIVGLTVFLHILSINLPITLIRIHTLVDWYTSYVTVAMMAIFIRTIFGLLCYILIDKIGRKKLLLSSGTLTGLTLIIHGILVNVVDDLSLNFRIGIFLAYEAFLTIGLNSIAHIYMAEAFPITKKINSIVAISIFENIIHIILIVITMEIYLTEAITSTFVFLFGGLIVLITAIVYNNVPETVRLTLREARREFK